MFNKFYIEIVYIIIKYIKNIIYIKYFNMNLIIGIILIIIWVVWLCLWFYFLYFLRQPTRNVPENKKVFVSPANGKIIAILEDPKEDEILYKKNNKVMDNFTKWLWDWCTMVSIMMTISDVHYQKAPNNATLIEQEYFCGKKYNAVRHANTMRATFQNEYNNMLFEQENWVRFRVIQIAWQLARRIVPLLDVDDTVQQWDIIWLIKFGSQVTIVFDKNVQVTAKVWDVVIDGETVLWKLRKNIEKFEKK